MYFVLPGKCTVYILVYVWGRARESFVRQGFTGYEFIFFRIIACALLYRIHSTHPRSHAQTLICKGESKDIRKVQNVLHISGRLVCVFAIGAMREPIYPLSIHEISGHKSQLK